jgi:hypothetical protein
MHALAGDTVIFTAFYLEPASQDPSDVKITLIQ